MAITQRSIQQDIQGQLPVIPNNGNPGGAYNMPQQVASTGPVPQQAPANPLAWVEPSEYMTNIKQLLQQQMMDLSNTRQQAYDTGPANVGFHNGQLGQPLTDAQGIPVDSDMPFVTFDPYKDMPQLQNSPALPAGTILPMRADGR